MGLHQDRRGRCVGGRLNGPVGQSPQPPGRLPQQNDDHRRGIARRRGRGLDPQGRRADAGRRPDRVAAQPRTHAAEVRPTGQSPWAEARGTASGMITPGEAATMAAELAMPDLDLIKQGEQGRRTGAGGWPGAGRVIPPAPRTPQSARMAPARIGSTTHRRDLAADLLQMAGRAIIDSIHNCKDPSPPFRGTGRGPGASEMRHPTGARTRALKGAGG
jgi:hypothetical protein